MDTPLTGGPTTSAAAPTEMGRHQRAGLNQQQSQVPHSPPMSIPAASQAHPQHLDASSSPAASRHATSMPSTSLLPADDSDGSNESDDESASDLSPHSHSTHGPPRTGIASRVLPSMADMVTQSLAPPPLTSELFSSGEQVTHSDFSGFSGPSGTLAASGAFVQAQAQQRVLQEGLLLDPKAGTVSLSATNPSQAQSPAAHTPADVLSTLNSGATASSTGAGTPAAPAPSGRPPAGGSAVARGGAGPRPPSGGANKLQEAGLVNRTASAGSSQSSSYLAAIFSEVYESGARALRAAGSHAGEMPPVDDAESRRRAKARMVAQRDKEVRLRAQAQAAALAAAAHSPQPSPPVSMLGSFPSASGVLPSAPASAPLLVGNVSASELVTSGGSFINQPSPRGSKPAAFGPASGVAGPGAVSMRQRGTSGPGAPDNAELVKSYERMSSRLAGAQAGEMPPDDRPRPLTHTTSIRKLASGGGAGLPPHHAPRLAPQSSAASQGTAGLTPHSQPTPATAPQAAGALSTATSTAAPQSQSSPRGATAATGPAGPDVAATLAPANLDRSPPPAPTTQGPSVPAGITGTPSCMPDPGPPMTTPAAPASAPVAASVAAQGTPPLPVAPGPSLLDNLTGVTGGEESPGFNGEDSMDKRGEAAEHLEELGLFAGVDEDDDDDRQHDLAKAFKTGTRWYKMRYWRLLIVAEIVALILVVVGVILHLKVDQRKRLEDTGSTEAFRWFYFVGAMPTIWFIMDISCYYLFKFLDWYFFRESLLYLQNVQRSTVTFLFLVALLPWNRVVFVWAWCGDGRCEDNITYMSAVDAVWKVLICLVLWSLANLTKGVTAKLLSTHFYRSAHFKKLQEALEKEVFLQVLSRPRSKVLQSHSAAQHAVEVGDEDDTHPDTRPSGVQKVASGLIRSIKSVITGSGRTTSTSVPDQFPNTHLLPQQHGNVPHDTFTFQAAASQSDRHTANFPAPSPQPDKPRDTFQAATTSTDPAHHMNGHANGGQLRALSVGRVSVKAASDPDTFMDYTDMPGSHSPPGHPRPGASASFTLGKRTLHKRVASQDDLHLTPRSASMSGPPLGRASTGALPTGTRLGTPPRYANPAHRGGTPVHRREADTFNPAYRPFNGKSAAAHTNDPQQIVEDNIAHVGMRIIGSSLATRRSNPHVDDVRSFAPHYDAHALRFPHPAYHALPQDAYGAGPGSYGVPPAVQAQGRYDSPVRYGGPGPDGSALAVRLVLGDAPNQPVTLQLVSDQATHAAQHQAPDGSTQPANGGTGQRLSVDGASAAANGKGGVAHSHLSVSSTTLKDQPLHAPAASPQPPPPPAAPHPPPSLPSPFDQEPPAGTPTPAPAPTAGTPTPTTGTRLESIVIAPIHSANISPQQSTRPLPPLQPSTSSPQPASQAAAAATAEAAAAVAATVAAATGGVGMAPQGPAALTTGSVPPTAVSPPGVPGHHAAGYHPGLTCIDESSFSQAGGSLLHSPSKVPPSKVPSENPSVRRSKDVSGSRPSTTSVRPPRATPPGSTRGAGAASVAGSEQKRRAPSFTQQLGPLAQDIVQAVPLQNPQNKDVSRLTEAELEKVRTAVVIKTYTAIIRNYSSLSPEEAERETAAIRAFSRALFHNIRSEGRSYITLDDFQLFFDNPDFALRAFSVFDMDGDGQVSRKEVRDAIESIYRERANMADSLRDTDSIVRSLEWAIGALVHFIFIAFYLLIWGVDIVQGFSTFSATLLAFTFIFGNSVKNMFEAMLFLFVEHPYDVGDNVCINNDIYRVKKITLLYTEFIALTGQRVFYPNTELINAVLSNWTRSKTMTEFIQIQTDVGVPPDVLADIMDALRELAEANPTEYDGAPFVQYRNFADPMKVVLQVSWSYAFAPDNWRRLVPARNAMHGILQAKLYEHQLHCTVQEVERKTVKKVALFTPRAD